MRFLLGLCLGAILVFAAATLLKTPEQLITTVDRMIAKPAVQSNVTSAKASITAQPDGPIEPIHLTDVGEEQVAAGYPQSPVPLQEQKTLTGGTRPEAHEASEPVAEHALYGTQPIKVLPEPIELANHSRLRRHPSETIQLASVWAPFHSQASAAGFARRLRAELDKDFTVHKAGPANYHVVFAYGDEQERSSIQRQIARVTGQGKETTQP